MIKLRALRSLVFASIVAALPMVSACSSGAGQDQSNITDVNHTDVERQSIGNCWIYAQATWVESMNLTATGKAFDVSQSYWTYWHWYEQILDEGVDEIETGGFFSTATDIVLRRGVMPEKSFVKEDVTSEMSSQQKLALDTMNFELSQGRLKDFSARSDAMLVRKVLDEAWALSSTVKGFLTKAFGKDGQKTLLDTGTTKFTPIIKASSFPVQYTERVTNPNAPTVKKTTLDVAIKEWRQASYPSFGSGSTLESQRRNMLIRVQKALHDAQPVVISWDVDFNAMENFDPALKGSFNMTTLKRAGAAGHQGGHMTVLEDYEAETVGFGLLKAGQTLDPNNPSDKAKLDAALLPSTKIKFIRIKNSWGGFRDDRAFAPGFPGYHDLYLEYLNGPITWCPDVEEPHTGANCKGTTNPLDNFVLPPGY